MFAFVILLHIAFRKLVLYAHEKQKTSPKRRTKDINRRSFGYFDYPVIHLKLFKVLLRCLKRADMCILYLCDSHQLTYWYVNAKLGNFL